MDLKKLIEAQNLSGFPVGLGGCRADGSHFESCGHDIVVFDETSGSEDIVKCGNELAVIHHASLYEIVSKKLLQYDRLQIIQDESWDLRMLLAKINEKRVILFNDFAKNSLIESLFCCQKTFGAIRTSSAFAPCWQKCASYFLADAISSLNHQRSSPTHMLDLLRRLEKNPVNEHISVATKTIGIERATPTLLERMLKSTMGFSDMVEKNGHSKVILQKYDFLVRNSMLSDCYFYLCYVNKENFMKIKDTLNQEPSLIHILKVAFDVEVDPNLVSQQADLVQKSCNDILGAVLRA